MEMGDLKFYIQSVILIASLVTGYWKLRISINRRPDYEKVESMIDSRAISKETFDDKVRKVVDDRSVSKVEFEKMRGDVAAIKSLLEGLITKIAK